MSNYYKKYLKYKLKYLEAKKSISGGGTTASASRGRGSPPPSPPSSPRGMDTEELDADIERLRSGDYIITLTNMDSGEELELEIENELITIQELKEILSRELNFDEGNIDIYMANTKLHEDDQIQEGQSLDFRVNDIPVFYDISHRANDLRPLHHLPLLLRNKRMSITKEEVRNIKNGDIVYTNEGNGLEFHIYINEGEGGVLQTLYQVTEGIYPLYSFRQYWNEVCGFLKGELIIPEFDRDYPTFNDLIEHMYNIFWTHHFEPRFRDHPQLLDLDYRPLFLKIINWSNKEEINSFPSIFNLFRNKNSFPNIYKALNFYMNKKKNNETDEDFLVNLKYRDVVHR